jgi:hypothetical protein
VTAPAQLLIDSKLAATPDDVQAAVAAARRAFDETSWSTDVGFRIECLRQLHRRGSAMTRTTPTACGFIGLRQIGAPMARRLTGEPLWVYDVSAAATTDLADSGADVAGSVAELAEHCGHISVMVRDGEQVRAVVSEILSAASAGTVVSVHSTVDPATPRALADLAGPHGVHVLDAPVSGGAAGANHGRLSIMAGVSADAFALARPVLELMADLVVHVGSDRSRHSGQARAQLAALRRLHRGHRGARAGRGRRPGPADARQDRPAHRRDHRRSGSDHVA